MGHHDHDLEHAVPTAYVDRDVIDPAGEKLGKVADVVPDTRTLEPRWLVVTSGVLKHAHFVPVEGSFTAEDGAIVVAYDKETVHHAVKANRDHLLTPEDEHELVTHYGLN